MLPYDEKSANNQRADESAFFDCFSAIHRFLIVVAVKLLFNKSLLLIFHR